MKEYPSISKQIVREPIYAFDKLDGSNIRAEWSKKRGFYKFGKRHGLVDETDPLLGEAKQLVLGTYQDSLSAIFRQQQWQRVLCFFEFYGPNSFAGNHEDEPHEVTLIDVAVEKKGILPPYDFIKTFMGVKKAKVLFGGVPTSDFVSQVKNGTYPGMTFEGVVCKGADVSPGRPRMYKIKSNAWLDRLKQKYADRPDLIEQLS